jgi:hypothetical protein
MRVTINTVFVRTRRVSAASPVSDLRRQSTSAGLRRLGPRYRPRQHKHAGVRSRRTVQHSCPRARCCKRTWGRLQCCWVDCAKVVYR